MTTNKHKRLKVRFSVYKAKDGWRWHAIAANGRLVAESGEAYKAKQSVKNSLQSLIDHIAGGSYAVEED